MLRNTIRLANSASRRSEVKCQDEELKLRKIEAICGELTVFHLMLKLTKGTNPKKMNEN